MTLLFAATYPERTAAVVLYGTVASFVRADDYPWALTPEEWTDLIGEEAPLYGSRDWLDRKLREFAPASQMTRP
jgi:hypothetical protein